MGKNNERLKKQLKEKYPKEKIKKVTNLNEKEEKEIEKIEKKREEESEAIEEERVRELQIEQREWLRGLLKIWRKHTELCHKKVKAIENIESTQKKSRKRARKEFIENTEIIKENGQREIWIGETYRIEDPKIKRETKIMPKEKIEQEKKEIERKDRDQKQRKQKMEEIINIREAAKFRKYKEEAEDIKNSY